MDSRSTSTSLGASQAAHRHATVKCTRGSAAARASASVASSSGRALPVSTSELSIRRTACSLEAGGAANCALRHSRKSVPVGLRIATARPSARRTCSGPESDAPVGNARQGSSNSKDSPQPCATQRAVSGRASPCSVNVTSCSRAAVRSPTGCSHQYAGSPSPAHCERTVVTRPGRSAAPKSTSRSMASPNGRMATLSPQGQVQRVQPHRDRAPSLRSQA